MNYPAQLQDIIGLFEGLPEPERREMLISFAESAAQCEPAEGDSFDVEDVRKDDECTDEVGIFLSVGDDEGVTFKVRLGPKVQTLTRAMTSILCRGLKGCTLDEVIGILQDFVPRIVGGELIRLRSQTVYYVLGRMKFAARTLMRQREGAGA